MSSDSSAGLTRLMKAEADAQKIIEDARNSTPHKLIVCFSCHFALVETMALSCTSHLIVAMHANLILLTIARRAQVKRAQDEAKSEIEAYRRTLEEDFKKKQDEVRTFLQIPPQLPPLFSAPLPVAGAPHRRCTRNSRSTACQLRSTLPHIPSISLLLA
jgi:hypothetical protein